jgi:hypothetical protein
LPNNYKYTKDEVQDFTEQFMLCVTPDLTLYKKMAFREVLNSFIKGDPKRFSNIK